MMVNEQISDLVKQLTHGELSRRQFIRRALGLGLSAAALAGVLAEAGAAAPRPIAPSRARYQADAKTLIIADAMSNGNWLNMDPGWVYEINPAACFNLVYEPLYHMPDSVKGEFEPLLADGMPQLSADGLEATIKLRPGVKFHTGNELTADDFVFSWTRLKNIKFQASFLAIDYWDTVEAVDPLTLKIRLKGPNAALVPILTSLPLSAIDSKVARENGATDAEDADTAEPPTVKEWITSNSIGTGPYRINGGWDLNSEVVVERFADYWGEAPKLDRIIWRNTLDPNTQFQLVEAGEVDMSYSLNLDSVESVKSNPDLQLITGPTLGIEYLGLKATDELGVTAVPKELRQAIAYAIDYDGIINGLLNGAGLKPATTAPFPLLGSEEVKDLGYKLDLVKAQEMWDAAGGGQREILCSYSSPSNAEGGLDLETLAAKVQSDVQKIDGLTFKLNPMDGTQRIDKYRAGELQATISPWTPDYPDVHSMTEPFARTGVAAAKRLGYSDPAVDALLDQGIAELDPEKRKQIYIDIQKALIDAAALLVLYQSVDQKPARNTVQGVTTHSIYQIQLRFASKTA